MNDEIDKDEAQRISNEIIRRNERERKKAADQEAADQEAADQEAESMKWEGIPPSGAWGSQTAWDIEIEKLRAEAEVEELRAEITDLLHDLLHVLNSIVGCSMTDNSAKMLEDIDTLVCKTLLKYVRPLDTLPLEADPAEAAYVARAKKYGPELARKLKEVLDKPEADHV